MHSSVSKAVKIRLTKYWGLALIMTVNNTVFENESIRLVELTDTADIKETQLRNHVEWGGGMTMDQYLLREKGCRVRLTSESTRMTNWALEAKNEQGEWELVSACETQRRLAYFKVKGRPVETTINQSIGAVFTAERYRGKGYAAKMLEAVTKSLKTWQLPANISPEAKDHVLLTLWSDVGDYYSRFGYVKNSTETLVISVAESANTRQKQGTSLDLITDENTIAALAYQQQQVFKSVMDRDTEEDGISRVAIVPSIGSYQYLNWRAIYHGPLLSKRKEAPSVFGAKTDHSWILWTQDFPSNKLYVLSIHSDLEDPNAVEKDLMNLFEAAVSEAEYWSLSTVEIWRQDLPWQLGLDQGTDTAEAPSSMNSGITIHGLVGAAAERDLVIEVKDRAGSWPCWHSIKGTKWVFAGKYCWF